MVLRVAAFLCLLALAASQTTMDMMTTTTEADMPTTMEPTTMEPDMTTAPPDVDPPDDVDPTDVTMVPSLEVRYNRMIARDNRASHFYCLDYNQDAFPVDAADNTPVLWALMLQYPILSYLDSVGKRELLDITLQLVRIGNPTNTDLNSLSMENICIANVTHYGVSTYEESILFNIYFVDPPREPRDINIVEFDRAFRDGFNSAEARDRGIIVPFLEGDRQRFAYNMTMVGGSRSEIMMAQDDPTQRAVVIHSFVGLTTIEEAFAVRETWYQQFAENPDPINFGLEAGDIIFAVFGTIFLTIVGGLIILGFCIHPFLA